jgi:hypothetical protein
MLTSSQAGTLYNYPDRVAPRWVLKVLPHTVKLTIYRPCEGACTIVGINSGLLRISKPAVYEIRLITEQEYPDGKNANIDTGMWLHQ